MATWNERQKGFIKRLAIVVASALAGRVLMTAADSQITDMGTTADVGAYFWLSTISGLLFLVSTVSAIVTLIYGRTHETAIRERKSVSFMLTTYRILFWLSVAASVLAFAFLVWVVLHLGPVR